MAVAPNFAVGACLFQSEANARLLERGVVRVRGRSQLSDDVEEKDDGEDGDAVAGVR